MSQGFGAQNMEAAVEALTSNGNQREPSMEEILASIRRIIEDNDTPAQSATESAPTRVADVSSEKTSFSAGGAPDSVDASQVTRPHVSNWSGNGVERTRVSGGEDAATAKSGQDVETFRAGLHDAPEVSVSQNEVDGAVSDANRQRPRENSAPIDRKLVQRLAEVQAEHSVREEAKRPEHQNSQQPHSEPQDRTVPDVPSSSEDSGQGILSDYAGRKVAAAFGELNEAFEASRRRSLDQMAEEILRPMLQDWLDDNLPTIVERLVREEIERIARGG